MDTVWTQCNIQLALMDMEYRDIMRSAGAATGEGGAVTITAARLTAAQCTLARTIAQELVDAFGS